MENDNIFPMKEIPYKELSQLGINRQMADLLPQSFKDKLLNGEVTPLLKTSITSTNGIKIALPIKMRIAVDNAGKPYLVIYPVRKDMSERTVQSLNLNQDEKSRLTKGGIIIRNIKQNEQNIPCYFQMDNETKSVLRIFPKGLDMDPKMKEFEKINDIELGQQQKQQLKEGKPVELNVGGEKVTVGIDLKEPQGFKVMKGDMDEWNRQKQMKYDEQHPEFIGLVMTDKNRWEYQQVVNTHSNKTSSKMDETRRSESPRMKI